MLFTCIKSWFFRNHLANFHQISHWSFCWNVIDSWFKWSCCIDCQAHIFFKTKNCSNDDIFISYNDRIGKMLHNICMSAVAMSLRWANRGPWASCYLTHWNLTRIFMLFIGILMWPTGLLCGSLEFYVAHWNFMWLTGILCCSLDIYVANWNLYVTQWNFYVDHWIFMLLSAIFTLLNGIIMLLPQAWNAGKSHTENYIS